MTLKKIKGLTFSGGFNWFELQIRKFCFRDRYDRLHLLFSGGNGKRTVDIKVYSLKNTWSGVSTLLRTGFLSLHFLI